MRGRVPSWDILSNLLQVVETLSVVYLEQRGAADRGLDHLAIIMQMAGRFAATKSRGIEIRRC